MPDAKINDAGWWLFTGPYGKSRLKFNEDKSQGILDHQYIDEVSSWDVPMQVVPNGDFSEVTITLNKPDELTDVQFDQRMIEIGEMFNSMKNILESDVWFSNVFIRMNLNVRLPWFYIDLLKIHLSWVKMM